jgi:hypothetical protein
LKIDKKKIATIVKSEDAENKVMKITLEEDALLVEYLSGWTEMKDLKSSDAQAAGMIIDHYRDSKTDLGGLILRCIGESLTSQITCLLSKDDVKRWIGYDFGIDELSTRIQ